MKCYKIACAAIKQCGGFNGYAEFLAANIGDIMVQGVDYDFAYVPALYNERVSGENKNALLIALYSDAWAIRFLLQYSDLDPREVNWYEYCLTQ